MPQAGYFRHEAFPQITPCIKQSCVVFCVTLLCSVSNIPQFAGEFIFFLAKEPAANVLTRKLIESYALRYSRMETRTVSTFCAAALLVVSSTTTFCTKCCMSVTSSVPGSFFNLNVVKILKDSGSQTQPHGCASGLIWQKHSLGKGSQDGALHTTLPFEQ